MSDAETWHAIVDANGAVISVGTVIAPADELAANGLTAVELAGDPSGMVWDVATRAFVIPTPVKPVVISTLDFVTRFSPTAFAAIEGSTDSQVRMFLFQLQFAPSGRIDLSSQQVQSGLAYLVSLGLITQDEATAIGTP